MASMKYDNIRISCPCGNRGRSGDDVAFETRGNLRGTPVQKCLACGRGLFLKWPKGRTKLVPEADWERMQKIWAEQFPDD